ncbi:MAG: DUF2332 domain-containing protein [Halolamina sp.]
MSLTEAFEGFADWCVGTSPLYERLARGTAEDDALLDLAGEVPDGKSPPHLLLAGVHALLLAGADGDQAGSDLARFYPTVVSDPVPVDAALVENAEADPAGEDPFPPFRKFALDHAAVLEQTFQHRRTQTNAVRRCAGLLPGFEFVSRRLDGEPFVLVEVGPSAGLNLRWDSYRYEYGDGATVGPDSPVTIESEIRGDRAPPLPEETMPPVAARLGIDLNPLDVTDPADARWLKALVWPEHRERHRLLDAACDLVRDDPPEIRQGDATELLPEAVAEFEADTPLVVYDTHVRYQLPDEAETAYREAIRNRGAQRTVHWLSGTEGVDGEEAVWLDYTRVEDGEFDHQRLLAYQQHGEWIRWER